MSKEFNSGFGLAFTKGEGESCWIQCIRCDDRTNILEAHFGLYRDTEFKIGDKRFCVCSTCAHKLINELD